jgi:hypothetical protein
MIADWDWRWLKYFKKERKDFYELWRIWWSICTTRVSKRIEFN